MRQTNLQRHGVSTVEFAVVCPLALFLIFATIIGAMGVYRYQQVAALAREGARWASVHGGQYEQETGNPAATAEDVFQQVILPQAVALEASQLSYSVTWDADNSPLSVDEDYETPRGNTVTVTVNYQWFPELYVVGPFTLSSTSVAQMMY